MYSYSIIIPAHNEEQYLGAMLHSVRALDFPHDRFEAVVVENGSTDKTLAIAKAYEAENIRVISTKTKGVSHARNLGAHHADPKTDWLIFIDVDSLLHPHFLKELDAFLHHHSGRKFSGGTATIHPIEKTFAARFWYRAINLTRRFTKYPWVMQILRHDLFGKISYNEQMTYGEDIEFFDKIKAAGKTFLLNTNQVETSARRFQKNGWLRVLSSWLFVWSLPHESKKKKQYTVVR